VANKNILLFRKSVDFDNRQKKELAEKPLNPNRPFYITKKELMAMKETRKIESKVTQRLYYSQLQLPKLRSNK
jgi:hypothetical protein